jgi:hypothetical protein
MPHSCCERIAKRCRLAYGSSRTGNDVHLSMAGEVDSALSYQRDIHRRSNGSVLGDVTFSLFKLPSSESADSGRYAVHTRHRHECDGYSVHFCWLWIGTKGTTADGNNVFEHCATSWRSHTDEPFAQAFSVGSWLLIRPPMQPKRLRSALPSYAACMSC